MLARARQSAPQDLPVDFVLADATVYPFDPASFDLLASRFGVMFFADPVLSFANMRKALRPSGGWRSPAGASRAKIRCSWRRCRRSTNTCRRCRSTGRKIPGRLRSLPKSACTAFWARPALPGVAMEPCPLSLDVAVGRGLDAAVQGALEIGPASRALRASRLNVAPPPPIRSARR